MVDQVFRTSRWIRERRPDLVVHMKDENRAIIFEVACALDNLVEEREKEKWRKYQELAADLAT